MKNIPLFLMALLLLVSGCDLTGAPTQSTWQEFSSQDAGFSVLMPGKPEEETLADTGSNVYKVDVNSVSYMVIMTTLPEESLQLPPDEFFEQYRDNLLERTQKDKAELKEEKEISLNGHQGREITLEMPSDASRTRSYLVDDRFYQVVIAGPREQVSRDGAKFLDSFKLLGQ